MAKRKFKKARQFNKALDRLVLTGRLTVDGARDLFRAAFPEVSK